MKSPWKSLKPLDATHEYVVLASSIPPLRRSSTMRLFRGASAVRKQLEGTDGLVGFSLLARPVRAPVMAFYRFVRPADDIVAYFGTVVSSYPTARWDVTDAISGDDRVAIQFLVREYAAHLGRELISEQMAVFRCSAGKIVSVVGYYDSAEFARLFWDDSLP